MTSRDFCFWLQGFLELREPGAPITPAQTECIQRHLALVFKHEIDPAMGDEKHQAALNETHAPKAEPKTPSSPTWGPRAPDDLVVRC